MYMNLHRVVRTKLSQVMLRKDSLGGTFYTREFQVFDESDHLHSITLFGDTPAQLLLPGEPLDHCLPK